MGFNYCRTSDTKVTGYLFATFDRIKSEGEARNATPSGLDQLICTAPFKIKRYTVYTEWSIFIYRDILHVVASVQFPRDRRWQRFPTSVKQCTNNRVEPRECEYRVLSALREHNCTYVINRLL